jgi:hypothetical protein
MRIQPLQTRKPIPAKLLSAQCKLCFAWKPYPSWRQSEHKTVKLKDFQGYSLTRLRKMTDERAEKVHNSLWGEGDKGASLSFKGGYVTTIRRRKAPLHP